MKHKGEVLHRYEGSVEHEGKTLDIKIKCYDTPIASERTECHTHIIISRSGVVLDQLYLPSVVEPEDSEKIMQDIKNNISKFKVNV